MEYTTKHGALNWQTFSEPVKRVPSLFRPADFAQNAPAVFAGHANALPGTDTRPHLLTIIDCIK